MVYLYKMTMWKTLYASIVMVNVSNFRDKIKQKIWHYDNNMVYLYKMTMWKTLYASVVMVTVLLFQEDNKTNEFTLWQ